MKFLIAKNDNLFCFRGDGNILYGEPYVGIFFTKKIRNPEGRIILQRKQLIFHIDCYRKWYDDLIVEKYNKWQENLNPQPKRGRRKKYKNGYKIHKIKALLYYHEKAGNVARANEVRRELDNACI